MTAIKRPIPNSSDSESAKKAKHDANSSDDEIDCIQSKDNDDRWEQI